MLSSKLRKRLELLRQFTDMPAGVYPGMYPDDAPVQFQKLMAMGYARCVQPHNSAHKDRIVITPAGRTALGDRTEGG